MKNFSNIIYCRIYNKEKYPEKSEIQIFHTVLTKT